MVHRRECNVMVVLVWCDGVEILLSGLCLYLLNTFKELVLLQFINMVAVSVQAPAQAQVFHDHVTLQQQEGALPSISWWNRMRKEKTQKVVKVIKCVRLGVNLGNKVREYGFT